MWSWDFWRQALERSAKSAAQALIGLWTMDQFDVLQADLRLAAGTAGGAAVLSLLTSIISTPFGTPGTPSLVGDDSHDEYVGWHRDGPR